MKIFNTLFIAFMALLCFQVGAQTRYLDPVFTGVTVERNVTYATNISILTGAPAALELKMDIYQPVEDAPPADRPLVIIFHTGSFLPPLFNGQITGAKTDSVVVEIATRLAKMGYVAAAATYRQGWLPTAPDQNARTGTLLQAVYRSVQDARSCIRYFRKTVAEDDNAYNIDPEKITLWGSGTGGYISLASGYLDRYQEIADQDKFLNSETLLPYVDTTLLGNSYGTTQTPLNLPNHVGYSSDFALSVNMGGALGEISWIEGKENEPAAIGFHIPTDPFAPFADGAVIVPTTNEFVVNVSGTRTAIARINEVGSNDVLEAVNAELLAANDPLTVRVEALSQIPFTVSGQTTTFATDNMYPFITRIPSNIYDSSPWDWWNKPTLDLIVFGTNAALGTMFNSDTLHASGLLTNPNMSPEKGKAYVDTIMAYFAPRAIAALDLTITNVEIIPATEVKLHVSPNPATDEILFQTALESPMQDIVVYDMNGRIVDVQIRLKANTYRLKRNNLPPGIYLAKIRFEKGIVTQKVVFK